MCSAYRAPDNGGVWPDGPVQAGTRVTVYCFDGYEEDYGDDVDQAAYTRPEEGTYRGSKGLEGRGRGPMGLEGRGRGTEEALVSAGRSVRDTGRRGGEVGGEGGGGSGRGRGRVGHPDVFALLRCVCVCVACMCVCVCVCVCVWFRHHRI